MSLMVGLNQHGALPPPRTGQRPPTPRSKQTWLPGAPRGDASALAPGSQQELWGSAARLTDRRVSQGEVGQRAGLVVVLSPDWLVLVGEWSPAVCWVMEENKLVNDNRSTIQLTNQPTDQLVNYLTG